MRTKTVRTYARGYCTIVKTNASLRLCVILFLKFEKYPRKNIVEIRRVVGLGVGEFFPLTRRIRRVVGLGAGEFRFGEWSVCCRRFEQGGSSGSFY